MKRFLMAGVCIAAFSTSAHAQEKPADTSSGVEEIVVTAQRRAENLQTVPASIQAVGQARLEAAGITALASLPKLAPNLNITDSLGFVQPYIRGVGATNSAIGVYASVATYIDGMYVARLSSGNFELDNVERIEILAGPQGALYGRNATGGAILVVTKTPRPGDVLSGRINLSYGNYDDRQVSASISGGLNDWAAISLSAARHTRDGFIKNLNSAPSHQNDFDDKDSWTFGGKLRLEPADWLKTTVSAGYNRAFEHQAYTPPLVGVPGTVAGLDEPQTYLFNTLRSLGQSQATAFNNARNAVFPTARRTIYDPQINAYEKGLLPGKFKRGAFIYQRDVRASVEHVISPTSTFDIVSTSGYTHTLSKTPTVLTAEKPGTSGSPAGLSVSSYSPSHTIQQEVHAVSTAGKINWIVGGYYFREHGYSTVYTDLPSGPSVPRVSLDFQDVSLSEYAQVGIPIGEDVRLIAGGRYTSEKYTIFDLTTTGVGTISMKSSKFTYSLKGQYTIDPGVMVYASLNTGFKSGTLNPSGPRFGRANPETIRTYEVGVKSEFLDGRVRANAAVYTSKYANIQNILFDGGTGGSFLIDGVRGKINGAEATINARVTDRLRIDIAGNLLDTKYTNNVFPGFCCSGGLLVKGNSLAGASKFTGSVAANYEMPTSVGKLAFNADTSYNSGFYFDITNKVGTGGNRKKPFTNTNARVALTLPGDRLTVAAWGRNVFNTFYWRTGTAVSGVHPLAVPSQPAQYGGSVSYKF